MKISKELYKELESAILSIFTLDTIPDQIYQENIKYTQAGYSDQMFNWDVFSFSKFPSKKLYDEGLNDEHINTALAKILGNGGLDKNGKK